MQQRLEKQGRPSALSPAMALFPLRLFLGVTFVYAGVQKLTDPGFLHPGAPTYIGTQLHGFAAGTPGGFLLRTFALPHPELAGIGVAIAEILIGLLATAGLFTRIAAAVRHGSQSAPLPHRKLAHDPLLPRPRPRLLVRLAALRPRRRRGPARARQRRTAPFAAIARRTSLRPPEGAADADDCTPRPGAPCSRSSPGRRSRSQASRRWPRGPTRRHAPRCWYSSAASKACRMQGAGGRGRDGASARAARCPPGAVKLGPASRLPSGQAATYSDPERRLAGHPDPRCRRQPQGVQRRLHPRRLHRRLRRRGHRLPLSRRRVQRRNR